MYPRLSAYINEITARKTSSFPCGCLLFAKSFSTVPLYSDENDFTKYNFLFQHLPACRQVYRHAETPCIGSFILIKFSYNIITIRLHVYHHFSIRNCSFKCFTPLNNHSLVITIWNFDIHCKFSIIYFIIKTIRQ